MTPLRKAEHQDDAGLMSQRTILPEVDRIQVSSIPQGGVSVCVLLKDSLLFIDLFFGMEHLRGYSFPNCKM